MVGEKTEIGEKTEMLTKNIAALTKNIAAIRSLYRAGHKLSESSTLLIKGFFSTVPLTFENSYVDRGENDKDPVKKTEKEIYRELEMLKTQMKRLDAADADLQHANGHAYIKRNDGICLHACVNMCVCVRVCACVYACMRFCCIRMRVC
jgi:hypothetical protein